MEEEDEEESLRVTQDDEIEVLKSIYNEDIKDFRESDPWRIWRPPEVLITLKPQESMTINKEIHVQIDLHIKCTRDYPKMPLIIDLKNSKGLSNEMVGKLRQALQTEAERLKGEVMIHELADYVKRFLHEHNNPPYKSFYDEMMCNQKKLEAAKASVQQQKRQQEKIREEKQLQDIRDEMLRKKEALKDEKRKRDTAKQGGFGDIGVPTPTISSPLLHHNSQNGENSTVKGPNRKRWNSLSSSGDACTEHTGIVSLTFNRNDRLVQRGHCLNHNSRGGIVYSGLDVATGQLVTITELTLRWRNLSRRPDAEEQMTFQKEVEGYMKQLSLTEHELGSLLKLNHKNLIQYLDMKSMVVKDQIVVYVLQQFISGVCLSTYLAENIPVNIPLLQHYTQGIVEALHYLHTNSVVHKDLRDTNVFLESSGVVKVAGYSLDKRLYDLCSSVTKGQEHDNFPPSLGRGGKKGDVYRLGILILSLSKGSLVMDHIPNIPANIPLDMQDFLRKCLMRDEHSRWSPHQLLEHSFLKPSIPDNPNTTRMQQKEKDEKEEEEDTEPFMQPTFSAAASGHSRIQHEFEVLKWLGKGGFGDVLKVRNKLDRRIYAIKRIRLDPTKKQLNRKIRREVKLLSRLNHENVVRYYNSWLETCEAPKGGQDSSSGSTSATMDPMHRSSYEILDTAPRDQVNLCSDTENFAPPRAEESVEWSTSYECNAQPQEDDDSSDEDDDAVFGTVCHSDSKSDDDIVFKSETDADGPHPKEDSVSISAHAGSEETQLADQEAGLKNCQFMYIQMEFCEKSTLRTAIDKGLHAEVDRMWRLFREIIEGLVHIHQQGMIHRDLKPVNIFLDSNDHVKIGDFGLATTDMIARRNLLESTLASGELRSLDQVDVSHSDGFGDGSLTGRVGTALYVAPEMASITLPKACYNQKVDIYSLGIIFFEMCYPAPSTGMERYSRLSSLRSHDVILPLDHEKWMTSQQISVIKWLLHHDPSKRPTSQELLASDLLPPPQLEETELNEMLRHTVSRPQSKAYKHMISTLFDQETKETADFTYDFDMQKGPSFVLTRLTLSLVKETLEKVMQKHGAVLLSVPTLMPKWSVYEQNEGCVHAMDRSGSIVSLPYDLRVPFARFIARKEILQLNRYAIEKVYRQRKVYDCHPRELYECAFDIVTSPPPSLLPDAEVISVVSEIISEFPTLKNKSYQVQLNHVNLLKGILFHCGIPEVKQPEVCSILSDTKNGIISKFQAQGKFINLSLSDQTQTLLSQFAEAEDSFPKISALLKSISKKKGEAASLVKQGLKELEGIISYAEALGVRCPVVVVPGLVHNLHIYSGMLFQFVCELKKKRRKGKMDVLAAGGRYDNLIASFRLGHGSSCSKEVSQLAVGVSIAVEKIVGSLVADEEFLQPSLVDVLVCSVGSSPMLKDKCAVLNKLWSIGVAAHAIDSAQRLEDMTEFCKDNHVSHILILKDTEPGSAKVRTIEKDRVTEKKIALSEVGDYFSKLLISKSEQVECGQICRSDSARSMSFSEGGTPNSNIHLTFLPYEKPAPPTKRRMEGQITTQLAPVLQRLQPRIDVHVLVIDLKSDVLKTIAAHLELEDEDTFRSSLATITEKYPRNKKYLNKIMDELQELKFEKKSPVIVLYSMQDNSYKVLM